MCRLCKIMCTCLCHYAVSSLISFAGEMRVQLLNQTLLELGFYDEGPYEVADQKQLNSQLIPVPYHSYLGRTCPPLLSAQERWRGPGEGDTRAQAVPQKDLITGTSNSS